MTDHRAPIGAKPHPVHSPISEGIDTDQFHDALSRLAGGVSIVTTAGSAGRCGLTVTSVTSVSDEPPIVLTCINHSARACDVLSTNGIFAVNVLGAHDEHLSNVFAGRTGCSHEERFDHAAWSAPDSGTGAPLLDAARVCLDCKVVDRIDSGTHRVFFGQVTGVHLGDDSPALLYMARRYHSL